MKRATFTIAVALLSGGSFAETQNSAISVVDQTMSATTVNARLATIPLAFTQNMGQWDERALFRADCVGV